MQMKYHAVKITTMTEEEITHDVTVASSLLALCIEYRHIRGLIDMLSISNSEQLQRMRQANRGRLLFRTGHLVLSNLGLVFLLMLRPISTKIDCLRTLIIEHSLVLLFCLKIKRLEDRLHFFLNIVLFNTFTTKRTSKTFSKGPFLDRLESPPLNA